MLCIGLILGLLLGFGGTRLFLLLSLDQNPIIRYVSTLVLVSFNLSIRFASIFVWYEHHVCTF